MKKIPILLVISLLFLCMKCEDYLEPGGLESTVYGRVYDSVNNIPFGDLKIEIIESNATGFYGIPRFIQVLDSTYTDADGYYEIRFVTSGKGDHYTVKAERNDSVWSREQREFEVETPNSGVEVNFELIHLYPLRLNVRVDSDVEHLPLRVNHTPLQESISIQEADTTVQKRIFMDKNSPRGIWIYHKISTHEYQEARFIIPATETTEETVYEIHVKNADLKYRNNR